MRFGAQPRGRRGTHDRPYSPLGLRLSLALFGLLACGVLAILAFRAGAVPFGWVLVLMAAAAAVDLVVVGARLRARRSTGPDGRPSHR